MQIFAECKGNARHICVYLVHSTFKPNIDFYNKNIMLYNYGMQIIIKKLNKKYLALICNEE